MTKFWFHWLGSTGSGSVRAFFWLVFWRDVYMPKNLLLVERF